QQFSLAHVIRAGARHQDSPWSQHLQSAQVQLLVSTERSWQVAPGFCKGRRIENDAVVLLSLVRVVTHKIEGIGFDPFNLVSVQGSVLVGSFERGAGAIHASNFFADAGQVQREASLIAEDIERVTSRISRKSYWRG